MPENKRFLPEGLRPPAEHTLAALREAAGQGEILEAVALRCGMSLRGSFVKHYYGMDMLHYVFSVRRGAVR